MTIVTIVRAEPYGPEVEGFRLGLSLNTNLFVETERIGMTICLTNTHNQPRFVLRSGLQELQFNLTNEKGENVPRKPTGMKLPSGKIVIMDDGPEGFQVGMKAGEADTFSSNLRFVFDVEKPGIYKLAVSRLVPTITTATNTNVPLAFTNVVSNPVEFTIKSLPLDQSHK